jgi:anaerobic magnesium-protoporphyrin IX monomethyl ester cyclase
MSEIKWMSREEQLKQNLGTRDIRPLPMADFPSADEMMVRFEHPRPEGAVDVMLVNPPAPDGGIWIRSQHRVGRRSRENMVWPQVSLAQMAALLQPDYRIEVVDAVATRMGWPEFEKLLREKQPKYYITQLTAPTLTNDMYGVFLARSLGAKTIAFGTHVTPMPRETMRAFPALDFAFIGEPELTLRELVDVYEGRQPQDARLLKLFRDTDPGWATIVADGNPKAHLSRIKGLVWRQGEQTVINPPRPVIPNLDDLPLPLHHLLPLEHHRVPMVKGPFTFVVTSRGCTAGCKYCIKHVSYQHSIRLRSPENIMEELWELNRLGIHNIHMYTDLFTVNREQVMGLCDLIIQEGLKVKWMCNSRVDYVDEEMLQRMAQAGNWLIAWGIESGNEEVLKRAHKGYRMEQAPRALQWAKKAGIMNWGYFIIGLPGETEETVRQTIKLSKKLPLDIALFHIAAPYPGTPFFFDVIENGWFRPGTRWEEVDMDESTVLDYPGLPAERLEYWQRRAFREWAMRPGPMWTFLKTLSPATLRSAVDIGLQTLGWVKG